MRAACKLRLGEVTNECGSSQGVGRCLRLLTTRVEVRVNIWSCCWIRSRQRVGRLVVAMEVGLLIVDCADGTLGLGKWRVLCTCVGETKCGLRARLHNL